MPNLFAFADWITMESLRILLNKAQIAPFFNTKYNKEFTREFAVGETVRVKLPQRFTIRDGLGYTPQSLERKYTTVTMDQIFGIDFEWDSAEKALKMERGEDAIRREYIEPAMSQIANEIDSRCSLYAYQNTNNIVGALGTTPTTHATYLAARTRLNELSCPPGERGMIVSPAMEAAITGSTTTMAYFNPSSEISRQYKEGSMGRASGFDWYSSNNLYDHTCGTWAAACTVQTTPVNGATSATVGGTVTQTFKKGDVFNFSASYKVNPVTRRSVGHLAQFVVTQDLTLTGGVTDTLYFKPALYGPGSQYQNVNAMPVGASAVITNFPGTTTPGTGPLHGINGLALHGDAFALVGVKLELPKAVELASQARDPETGLSVRFIRMFDAQTSKMVNRFDVLCGFGDLYPDNCSVRVLSLL
jgi:hypothetical protein